ncbi:proto-oncogene c-Rel isoform X2 [Anabrus simplex]
MYSGGGSTMDDSWKHQAYVKIIEQPASKALRFRYECEGRSAGSIPGVSSTPENKTFPSIQIVGYKGRAVVVVSCVTKDPPYRPHPHNLVGKEGCKKGVCTVEITSENMTVSFSNLGIQCVKKKDIDDALKVREDIRVDPFRTGFSHRSQPTSIDLNAVRLCFQVFLEGSEKGKFSFPLPPVVSDPIYDKKAMSDLTICKLSDCSSSVAGGKEIILLCEKVTKDDIQVHFVEEQNGVVVWEGYGDFQPTHVHKQVAISFRAPRYKSLEVEKPVKVFIELRRPSDGATSERLPFEFLPLDSDPKRKKPKALLPGTPSFPDRDKPMPYVMASPSPEHVPMMQHVKREPLDPTMGQGYFVGRGGTSPRYAMTTTPSPQPQGLQITPSPSPHSMGRTPPPMEYGVSAATSQQHMAGGGVFYNNPYGVPHMRDMVNVNVMGVGQEVVQVGMGTYVPAMRNVNPNVMADLNIRPGHSDLKRHPANIPNANQGLNMGNFLGGPNLTVGPKVGLTTSQGIPNITTAPGLGEGIGLDFDRQNNSLEKIDSSDLAHFLESNLSDNLSSNLTLSETAHQSQYHELQNAQQCRQQGEGQINMSDSLTRLANTAIQDICDLNNMYKGGEN